MTAIVTRGGAANLQLPDETVDLVVTSPPYWQKTNQYQPPPEQDQRGNHLRDVTTERTCATCDNHGDFLDCCDKHSLPLCGNCLATIHFDSIARKVS